MTNTVETNEELIAKARELCEKEIAKLSKEFAAEREEIQSFKESGNSELVFGAQVMERALAREMLILNSWTTHLAEMEEHKENEGKCSHCYNDCHSRSGLICEDYCNTYDSYPCNFLVTKVKRLLGVE